MPALRRRSPGPNPPCFSWSRCKRSLTRTQFSVVSCTNSIWISILLSRRNETINDCPLEKPIFVELESTSHSNPSIRSTSCRDGLIVSTFFDSSLLGVYSRRPDLKGDWLPQSGPRDAWSATTSRQCKGCTSQNEIQGGRRHARRGICDPQVRMWRQATALGTARAPAPHLPRDMKFVRVEPHT
jgi:hypothetical protein